jgi:hypothetical protein
MSNACARLPKAANFVCSRMHHVGVPHIRANPAKVFRQFHGRPAKRGSAVRRLIKRFGKVRM